MAPERRMRVSGTLMTTPRGRMLCDAGGMHWRLTGKELEQWEEAGKVTIEGVRRGLSVIDVYYVGRLEA